MSSLGGPTLKKKKLLITSRFGDINQPYKKEFMSRIKSVINYLPRCSYSLLYKNSKIPRWIKKYSIKIFRQLKIIFKAISIVSLSWISILCKNLFIKCNKNWNLGWYFPGFSLALASRCFFNENDQLNHLCILIFLCLVASDGLC